MKHIYLVRHGQDEDNAKEILNGRRDTTLTDKGREQAHAVAHKLQNYGISAIYSSPLKRALETANIIGEHIKVNVQTLPALIERDFGVLTGIPIKDIPKYSKNHLKTKKVLYFLDGEGTEDFDTLLERGGEVLDFVEYKVKKDKILLVTHGDIGKMIRAAYHDWTWEKGLKTPYFDNTDVLELTGISDKIA